jgi:hypothetical protein
MAPDLTPAMPHFAFFTTYSRREPCRTGILRCLKEDLHAHQPHRLNPLRLFYVGYLKDKVVQKYPHIILELETVIQPEIETISTEILTNFVLRPQKVRDLLDSTRNVFKCINDISQLCRTVWQVSCSCVQ